MFRDRVTSLPGDEGPTTSGGAAPKAAKTGPPSYSTKKASLVSTFGGRYEAAPRRALLFVQEERSQRERQMPRGRCCVVLVSIFVRHSCGRPTTLAPRNDFVDSSEEVIPPICTRTNIVLPRNDGVNNFTAGGEMPYSVTDRSFPLRSSGNPPDCTDVATLLTAIREGHRTAVNGGQTEKRISSGGGSLNIFSSSGGQSVFEPARCAVPIANHADMATTLKAYGSVHVCGDSLSKHMFLGAELRWMGRIKTSRPTVIKDCTCDGQFSENLHCRSVYSGGMIPHNLDFDRSHFMFDCGASMPCDNQRLSPNDSPPVVLWIQGGVHAGGVLSQAESAIFNPIISGALSRAEQCGKRLIVLTSGLNLQSPNLDKTNPAFDIEHVAVFNAGLANFTAALTDNPRVFAAYNVDFTELTRGALTSDGGHYLTDVNLAKADVLFRLLRLLDLS